MSTRIRLSRVQLVCVTAGLAVMVEGGRAAAVPATWWDVLVVGAAVAALAVALAWPKPRRRAPAEGRSILSADERKRRRVDNQVLSGGHTAWSPPAGQAVVVRTPSARPRTHVVINMRLAVAEELLEAHGLTADYRHMVSAVEQDAEAEQPGEAGDQAPRYAGVDQLVE